jgi:hypothetical protein
MADDSQSDVKKRGSYVWLSLAISVLGGIFGFLAAQYLNFRELELKEREANVRIAEATLKAKERDDRVHTFKLDIIKYIAEAKFQQADAVMFYLLKPIEKNEKLFDQFRSAMLELKSKAAPESPASALAIEVSTVLIPDEPATPALGPLDANLVRMKFSGPDRLNFRNDLIRRFNTTPDEILNALIGAIIPPDKSDTFRYRINLYIAFTLGGIPNGWNGSQDQLNRLIALRKTSDYRDITFKTRLEEAISNQ